MFALGSSFLRNPSSAKVFRAYDLWKPKAGFVRSSTLVSSRFGNLVWSKQTPNCLLNLRFGHLGGLKQTPVNTLLLHVGRRYCAQLCPKQLITKHLNLFSPSIYGRLYQDFDPWKMAMTRENPFTRLFQGRLKQTRKSLVDDVVRRCSRSYVDKYGVYHFTRRSCGRSFLIASLVGFSLAAATYLSNLETIPYSKRTHLVLLPRKFEKRMGESTFKDFKDEHEGKILPDTHPTSLRVKFIANNVIQALERGLRDDKIWGGPNYASRWKDAWKTLWRLGKELICNKGSSEIGELRASRYLEHVDWEVIVVNESTNNAYCYPGGKIVMFTGRLKYLKSDAEIAADIGHEVAHAVARHTAEEITKSILRLFWDVTPILLEKMLSRKMELEADYIGMLLMASAGYDPRAAASVMADMAEVESDDDSYWTKLKRELFEYISTHPSDKKRVELLGQAQEEAMDLYRERLSHLRPKREDKNIILRLRRFIRQSSHIGDTL